VRQRVKLFVIPLVNWLLYNFLSPVFYISKRQQIHDGQYVKMIQSY